MLVLTLSAMLPQASSFRVSMELAREVMDWSVVEFARPIRGFRLLRPVVVVVVGLLLLYSIGLLVVSGFGFAARALSRMPFSSRPNEDGPVVTVVAVVEGFGSGCLCRAFGGLSAMVLCCCFGEVGFGRGAGLFRDLSGASLRNPSPVTGSICLSGIFFAREDRSGFVFSPATGRGLLSLIPV